LFLGSQDAASNETGCRENHVTHVLNVATGVAYTHYDNIIYKTIEVMDVPETKIKSYFEEAFKFIDEGRNSGGVLVHCNAGVSRSASIVIAYLMTREKMSFEEALHQVRNVKKDIRPNEGFTEQLKDYEKEITKN